VVCATNLGKTTQIRSGILSVPFDWSRISTFEQSKEPFEGNKSNLKPDKETMQPYQLAVLDKEPAPKQATQILCKAIDYGYWTKFTVHSQIVTVTIYRDSLDDFTAARKRLKAELPNVRMY
jgi:hypothetical protein